jgi:hypothetical protein
MAWNPFAQDSAKAGVVGSQAGGIQSKHKALVTDVVFRRVQSALLN